MPYSIVNQSGQSTYNIVEYVVNTENDVADVPTDAAPGSSIFVIETGDFYMLSVANEDGIKIWNHAGAVTKPYSKLSSFVDNINIESLYDETSGANYHFIRIYRDRIDGTKQYPFVIAPNRDEPGTFSTKTLQDTFNFCLAINGGIFDTSNVKPDGLLIQKGGLIQNGPAHTHSQPRPLTIDRNGNLGYAAYNADGQTLINSGIYSAVTGFMEIVIDYEPTDPSTWNNVSHYTENAQRQIIGQFGNDDYGILTCEGRNYDHSDGWTVAEAQEVCVKYGFKFAYLLDGGGSTETMIGQRHINTIYEGTIGRIVPTFIVFSGEDQLNQSFDYILFTEVSIKIFDTSDNNISIPIKTNLDLINAEIITVGNSVKNSRIEVIDNIPTFICESYQNGTTTISIKSQSGITSQNNLEIEVNYIDKSDIVLLTEGGIRMDDATQSHIYLNPGAMRAAWVSNKDCGQEKILDLTGENRYPIQIPSVINNIYLDFGEYYFGFALYNYDIDTNKYTRIYDAGWKGTPLTVDLTQYKATNNILYYTISIRKYNYTNLTESDYIALYNTSVIRYS